MNPIDSLYPYQKDARNATFLADKGIVCLPTGTGKTRIQAAMIADDILQNPNLPAIYVVNAPRIMLSYQLLKEFYSFMVKSNIECRYMFVHSGGKADESELEDLREEANNDGHNIPYSIIESGISTDKIKDMLAKAHLQNLPIVFFSTYNSSDKIEIARNSVCPDKKISIVLNDEAQYLVQEQFHDIINILQSDRTYFFTATTIHTPSDKGRGMNNVSSYGEILYSMTPRTAIDMGKMVRPRLHVITTPNVYTSNDYQENLNTVIYEAYKQHQLVLHKEIKGKILVSVKGTLDIKRFLSSAEYSDLRNQGVDIYAVACHEEIKNDINGMKVSRQEFLKQLRIDGNNPDKKLIVLHYDVLSEGLDVSGLTGVLVLRTLNKSKFLQTFGRCARLDNLDRKNLEIGDVTPDQLENLRKPYAYVIIPNVTQSNDDDRQNLFQLISELRSYDYKFYETIVSSSYINGIPQADTLNGLNNIMRRVPNIGTLIQNLYAEIEAKEISSLTKNSFLSRVVGLFK